MPETRRKFAFELRATGVRIVREAARPVAEIAGELGIDKYMRRNRAERDRVEPGEAGGLTTEDPEGLIRL